MIRIRRRSWCAAEVAGAMMVVAVIGVGCGGSDGVDDDTADTPGVQSTVADDPTVDTVEWVDEAPDVSEGEILVGLRLDDAEALAGDEGWEIRVAILDGEEFALTMDYVPNRANVEVTDGIVTGILGFG